MKTPHIWLRAETKSMEERTALTPNGVTQLMAAGFKVTVERSEQNIFDDAQYQQTGCQMADSGSWTDAPADTFILGLKELPEADLPLGHRHIYFAHAYKDQQGWRELLARFAHGQGTLYDLEFLLDDQGRRIAAFGGWAGFAGAALAVKTWAGQQLGHTSPLAPVESCKDQDELVSQVQQVLTQSEQQPVMMVIGAKGRSGQGAIALAKACGIDVIEWDLEETRRGGPFEEINQADILINCVLINRQLPPFITFDILKQDNRQLSVISDVSCDPFGDYNPLPVYQECTTFDQPTQRLLDSKLDSKKELDLIAIDHLPSLLPKESSEDFCAQLLPHLLGLGSPEQGVWAGAGKLFQEKVTLSKG